MVHRGGKGAGDDWEVQVTSFITNKGLLFPIFPDFLGSRFLPRSRQGIGSTVSALVGDQRPDFFQSESEKITF